uniref:MULE domain-containing protein n=1 Tax=Steinernema glaseri TaxID=37863 RepID=A0A1I7ZFF1_9BILA
MHIRNEQLHRLYAVTMTDFGVVTWAFNARYGSKNLIVTPSNGGKTSESLAKVSALAVTKYSDEDEVTRDNIRHAACGRKPTSTTKAFRRARAQQYPTIASLDVIPESLGYTFTGLHANPEDAQFKEIMLRYKSPELVLFLSPYGSALLKRSEHIICDGTFKFAPQGTTQIYRIFGLIGGEATPFATALMTRKREQDYELLWTHVRSALDESSAVFNIRFAHFDSEVAAVKAFQRKFPEVKPKMCLFHVKQNITRHMQRLGLISIYESNPLMEKVVRQLGALCLIPVNTVETTFEQLRSDLPSSDDDENWPPGTCTRLQQLYDYYQKEWIQHHLGIDFVNLYDITDGPRTTNNAEGYHSGQRYRYRAQNMPLGEWLHNFQKVHHFEETHIRDVLNGRSTAPPRLDRTVNNDRQLKQAREGLEISLDLDGENSADAIKDYLARVGAIIGYNRTEYIECDEE